MLRSALKITIAPICFIVLWSLIAPVFKFPSIYNILLATVEMINNGTLFHDIFISSYRALSGFVIGFLLGTFIGVLTGRYIKLFLILGGLLLFFRWTPVLAILPITIRIGGIGEIPKIFIISWACFFVSWMYIHVAVKKLKKEYIWWAESQGLTFFQKLLKVYLPAISPSLIGAARTGLAISLIVVVAAELGGTFQSGFFREGLGYRISRAIETGRNDINIACILAFGFLGLLFDVTLTQFIKKILSPITKIYYHRDVT